MKRVLAGTAAVAFLSLHAAAQTSAPDAGALINAATAAMGTANCGRSSTPPPARFTLQGMPTRRAVRGRASR